MTVRSLLLWLAATILSEGIAAAQPVAGNNLTPVSYPVVDLVVPGGANRDAKKITSSEDALMAYIGKKVAPATWEQAGGPGTMRYESKGYVLHVRQTPHVHAELKSFLKQLLRDQISIEVHIVTVSAQELERLGTDWVNKDGIISSMIDDLGLFRFLESAQRDRATQIMQMPKVTMFDGQQVTIKGDIQARLLPTISTDRRHVTVQAEILSAKNPREPDAKVNSAQPPFGDIKMAIVAKVPDRRTVAILAGTTVAEVRTEYSLFGRIPYLSRLGRNVGWSRDTANVIIFLTPRVICEEEAAFVQPLRTKFQAEDNGKFPLIQPPGGQ